MIVAPASLCQRQWRVAGAGSGASSGARSGACACAGSGADVSAGAGADAGAHLVRSLAVVALARLCRRRWRVAGAGADAGADVVADAFADAGAGADADADTGTDAGALVKTLAIVALARLR